MRKILFRIRIQRLIYKQTSKETFSNSFIKDFDALGPIY